MPPPSGCGRRASGSWLRPASPSARPRFDDQARSSHLISARTRGRGGSRMATAARKPGKSKGADLPVALTNKQYEKELERLQIELLYMQEWVQHEGLRVVVLFE